MRRITQSPTYIKTHQVIRPIVAAAASRLRLWHTNLSRNRSKQRQVIVLCAGLAAAIFFVNVMQLQSQQHKLSAHYNVLIATREIAAGQLLTASSLQKFALPASIFTIAAITNLPEPAYAQQDIAVGDVITLKNVAQQPASIAIVPPGWRTVAISPQSALPPMQLGDHVDVIANGVVLVTDAIVVSAKAETVSGNVSMTTQVVIAIPAEAAAAVATAAAFGDATLVVAP